MTTLPDLKDKVAETLRAKLVIEVECVTYTGSGHASRPDKNVRLLTCIDANGDPFSLLIGEKVRGPTLVKTAGEDVKKLKQNAFFSLKNAGFAESNIKASHRSFRSAEKLWSDIFQKDHLDNPLALRAYLRLCGVELEEGGAFDAAVAKAGMKVRPKDTPVENPYGGNPLWGAL